MIEHEPRPFADTVTGGIVLGLAVLFAWIIAAQIVPAVALVFTYGPSEETLIRHLPEILALGAVLSVGFVVVLKLLGWLPAAPVSTRSWTGKAAWTAAWIVACLGGSMLLGLFLDAIDYEVKEQDLIVKAAADGGLALVLAGAVAAPLGEELAFRRTMFSIVRRGAGRIAAYVLTMLCFALVHGNPSAIPHYLWMAFCFAAAYEMTGSFWGAFAVHAANNLLSFLLPL
jgi:membrane protease YdiL (CAAX protease family)